MSVRMKKYLEDLAFLGGKQLFEQPLHVGQVNLPEWERFEEAFESLFERRYFTNHGPLVEELEEKIASYLGVRHVVCMTNGTIALMATAKALELTGEVILPAFTFVASAQAMSWAGLTPVFCDVDPISHTIDPALVESLITERTSAIMGVHLWGRGCDVEALQSLADKHGVKLFFDAAHSFGCSYKGRMMGNWGEVEVFSMHATKIFSASEGGFAATNDDVLANRLRTVRNFHSSETHASVPLRINGKMSEAQAAMGLLSLEEVPTYINENKARYEAYRDGLKGIPGLTLLPYSLQDKNNYQYTVVQVDTAKAGLTRDDLVRVLESENILARRYFKPGVHTSPPYNEANSYSVGPLPVTESLSETLFQLPNGQSISNEDINQVCGLIRFVQSRWEEISKVEEKS